MWAAAWLASSPEDEMAQWSRDGWKFTFVAMGYARDLKITTMNNRSGRILELAVKDVWTLTEVHGSM